MQLAVRVEDAPAVIEAGLGVNVQTGAETVP